jgi:hypothetical protein
VCGDGQVETAVSRDRKGERVGWGEGVGGRADLGGWDGKQPSQTVNETADRCRKGEGAGRRERWGEEEGCNTQGCCPMHGGRGEGRGVAEQDERKVHSLVGKRPWGSGLAFSRLREKLWRPCAPNSKLPPTI